MRLLLLDVDGTIVDSQGHIQAAMERAFAAEGDLEERAEHGPPPVAPARGLQGRSGGAPSAPIF